MTLDGSHFRWLKITPISQLIPFLIMLFFNHPKWNSSQTKSLSQLLVFKLMLICWWPQPIRSLVIALEPIGVSGRISKRCQSKRSLKLGASVKIVNWNTFNFGSIINDKSGHFNFIFLNSEMKCSPSIWKTIIYRNDTLFIFKKFSKIWKAEDLENSEWNFPSTFVVVQDVQVSYPSGCPWRSDSLFSSETVN